MQNITDKIASTHLGKKSTGSAEYAPSLLVCVPRDDNRIQYEINSKELPFLGYDIWHGYEFSALTENGVPVTRVLKLKYSCESKFLIESKSLKLYLNSFNMTRIGKSTAECLENCGELIRKDLSEKLETPVAVSFLSGGVNKVDIFKNYINIMDFADETNLKIEHFKEAPEVLKADSTQEVCENRLYFESLRSNCRVTHQPDFGDVFIYYKSAKHIVEETLIKYLVSFRSEYHFHEECCEMIYKRLFDLLDREDELMVSVLYTRRGGIDICPVRYSKNVSPKEIQPLLDTNIYAGFSIKQ